MKQIYKQEGMSTKDRINADIDIGVVGFFSTFQELDYERPVSMKMIFLHRKDAADFCIEILQELFKDAEFKAETLARWGVKQKQPEWVECPDEEIKFGDWVRCKIGTAMDNTFIAGNVYKVTDVDYSKTYGILIDGVDGSWFIKRFVKVIQK